MRSRERNPLRDVKPLSPILDIDQTTTKQQSPRMRRECRCSAAQNKRSRIENLDQMNRRSDEMRDSGAQGGERNGCEGENRDVWLDCKNGGNTYSAASMIEMERNSYDHPVRLVLRREDAIIGQEVKEKDEWVKVRPQYQVEFDEDEWDWIFEREKEVEDAGMHVSMGLGTFCCGGGH